MSNTMIKSGRSLKKAPDNQLPNPNAVMASQSNSNTTPIRLYGGADDSGIIMLPVLDGREPVALMLSSGVYISTGLRDYSGKMLFAIVGSEGALWLKYGGLI